jgi:hypothetical protein
VAGFGAVIPAKAGIQPEPRKRFAWIPAFAGMTYLYDDASRLVRATPLYFGAG